MIRCTHPAIRRTVFYVKPGGARKHSPEQKQT